MKRSLEKNETLTQIVNDAGRPSRPDGFTNLWADYFFEISR